MCCPFYFSQPLCGVAVIIPILWLRKSSLRKTRETCLKSRRLYVVEAGFQLRSVWVQCHAPTSLHFLLTKPFVLGLGGESWKRRSGITHTQAHTHTRTHRSLVLLPIKHGISTCRADWGRVSTWLRTPSKKQSFLEASAGGGWPWFTILFRPVLYPKNETFPLPHHLRITFQMGGPSQFPKKQGMMDASLTRWKTCFLCYSHFTWRFDLRLHLEAVL